jgi:hypothetical protein
MKAEGQKRDDARPSMGMDGKPSGWKMGCARFPAWTERVTMCQPARCRLSTDSSLSNAGNCLKPEKRPAAARQPESNNPNDRQQQAAALVTA